MASKGYIETDRQCRGIVEDARQGIFRPVYLLMGDEPYYPELVCKVIMEHALQDWERDFNETVCYGADVNADTIITTARRFPMMAERQLVVLKEAQAMKTLEQLSLYCQNPLDSTVLVILMRGTADKRKALYKSVLKNGVIVESPQLRDYEIPKWTIAYYREQGLEIDPEAAALLGEHAGTDLGKIAVETGKLLKNLPEGAKSVSVADIEKNVGISREFSIFELTKALSFRNAAHALKVASHVGNAPKFAMPMAVSALYSHFYRILKYASLLSKGPVADDVKARVLGVNPYFFREYDAAVSNYPLRKCMATISLLCDYDYKGKGGDCGEASPADLLVELTSGILNL